jgi:tetratricopeptide (TPR) repeat protein
MVELIPCIGEVVKTPYYVLGLGMNVYSIEELCFYLCENAYILDRDIMDVKLCQWLEREVGLRKLGAGLFEQLQKEKDLSEFVTTILRETRYCSEEELEEIEQILVDNASLGFAQKRKARGDSLLRSNKYSLAIEEYQYILQGMQPEENEELYASILHNTGTAYAKLFLFAKAGSYYKMAYDISQNEESYTQYLATLRIAKGQEEYVNAIVLKGLDKEAAYELEDRITEILASEIDTPYQKAYQQIMLHKQNGRISEFYDAIDATLNEWKKDYRKGMMNT